MVGYPSQDGYYLVWNVESAVLGHEGGVEDEVQHVGAVGHEDEVELGENAWFFCF